ncbi:hypothetical protein Wenmar_01599 [Wenxinia marina DSM 24838]|uniref:Uncharacterized protein n=1 Tax=Wenxinia marina DSM 24838 TaxID=1123501 RepID=A0A0D0Q6D8_9RHOB|nr:hypothetical protein Wenmar_01599 [Wenxinia marina DSM 24838]
MKLPYRVVSASDRGQTLPSVAPRAPKKGKARLRAFRRSCDRGEAPMALPFPDAPQAAVFAVRSNRSAFITLVQARTKSRANFSLASAAA